MTAMLFKFTKWDSVVWTVLYYVLHIVSCSESFRFRNVVCIYIAWFVSFLRRWNARFYLRVMYKLLHCPETPSWRFPVLPIRALKIISNQIYIYIYILIRKLEPSFLLLLRHILKHNLSYMLGYVERDRSWCIHRGRTCRTDHLTLNLSEISIFEDILLHLIWITVLYYNDFNIILL